MAEDSCAVVYNSLPLTEMMGEDAQRVSDYAGLPQTDILAIYPARLTTGKRFEKAAALAGAIKSGTGKSVKIVFCDFPSADIPSGVYKKTHKD